MQRSIKSFFKTQQPANPPPSSPTPAKEEEEEEEVVFKRKRQASFLDSPPSKREMLATKKENDADQAETMDSEEKKDSTPEADAASTPPKQVPNDTPSKQAPTVTPAKQAPAATLAKQQLFGQSPLMNVEALIRVKISSGSHALHENMGTTWFKALQSEFDKSYFKKLSTFIQEQRKTKTVFPPPDQVFTWTHYHTIRDTRVVVIGQDPYHGPRQAHGLSFSVQRGVAIPKSLQNIYKELANDIDGFKPPPHGNLVGWAKQGVLMLNACLTVNQGDPNSHQGKGWETLTDAVISWISKNVNHNVVFLLWGKFAQKKSALIDKRHKILMSAHPSPFSADSGFFGCKHFSQTNAFLKSQKLPEINWSDL